MTTTEILAKIEANKAGLIQARAELSRASGAYKKLQKVEQTLNAEFVAQSAIEAAAKQPAKK